MLPQLDSPAAIMTSSLTMIRKNGKSDSSRRLAGASTCLTLYLTSVIQQARSRRTDPQGCGNTLGFFTRNVIVNSAKPIQSAPTTPVKGLDETGDADVEEMRETDRDRCQTVMTSTDALEAGQLGKGTFWDDFIPPKRSTSEGQARKGNCERWTTSCHFTERLGIVHANGRVSAREERMAEPCGCQMAQHV